MPWLWHCCQFCAHCCSFFCRFLPSRMGCNSLERDVMGGTYRHRNDTSKLKHVSIRLKGFLWMCFVKEALLPRLLRGGRSSTQRTAVPRRSRTGEVFCVQLLQRGAATPSSVDSVKTKNKNTSFSERSRGDVVKKATSRNY